MHESVRDAECTACLGDNLKFSARGACGARPPDRVGNGRSLWWCASCRSPPCARCGSAPRPKTAKYRVWNVQEWACIPCRALCRGLNSRCVRQCLCEKRCAAPSVTKQTCSAPRAGGQSRRRAGDPDW
eukprot:1319588-Pyramimonas_sp.AAC.1